MMGGNDYKGLYVPSGGKKIYQGRISSLIPDATYTLTHKTDNLYKRIAQVFMAKEGIMADWDFDLADRTKFFEENILKTDFVLGKVQLKGVTLANQVGIWTWEDNYLDSSGYGNNGAPTGTTFVDGKVGKCVNFAFSTDEINCGNKPILDITNAITLETWIYVTSFEVNAYPFQKSVYAVYMNPSNTFRFYLQTTSGIKYFNSPVISLGQWYHLVCTYDKDAGVQNMKIYLNGYEVANTTWTGTILISATPLLFGAYGFYGKMDETTIFNRAITSAEVLEHYNVGMGGQHLAGYDISQGWYVRTDTNQINTLGWTGITSYISTENTPTNTQIRILVSVDNRTTWKKWDGSAWVSVNLTDIDTQGMSKTEIEAITKDQWDLLFVAGTLDAVWSLKTTVNVSTPLLDQITIKYLTSGYMAEDEKIDIYLISPTQTTIKNVNTDILRDIILNVIL